MHECYMSHIVYYMYVCIPKRILKAVNFQEVGVTLISKYQLYTLVIDNTGIKYKICIPVQYSNILVIVSNTGNRISIYTWL